MEKNITVYSTTCFFWNINDTVDRRNPAPPGMLKILYKSHHPWWCRILSIISIFFKIGRFCPHSKGPKMEKSLETPKDHYPKIPIIMEVKNGSLQYELPFKCSHFPLHDFWGKRKRELFVETYFRLIISSFARRWKVMNCTSSRREEQ